MSGQELTLSRLRREFAGLAASAATVEERATAILHQLERILRERPHNRRNPRRANRVTHPTRGAGSGLNRAGRLAGIGRSADG